jgi:hypothetical protein
MFYEDVIRGLNRRRVDYLVAGGVALVLHGVLRLKAGGMSIPLGSVKDMIRLKELAGRPQDIADAAALREIERRGKRRAK